MNPVQRMVTAVQTALKTLTITYAPIRRSLLLSTRYDYSRDVKPYENSIVMACANWLGRTFPEAPVQVLMANKQGQYEPVTDHPMLDLMETPNPYYSGVLLWAATVLDRLISGNAYWLKVRSGVGRPVQLWWTPSTALAPRRINGSQNFIDYYEYNALGTPQRIEITDVVHFRHGIDPDNPMLGLSPLAPLFREIFMDDEASAYAASMLKNLGVPPVLLSPDGDATITKEDAVAIKEDWLAKTTGGKRGEPVVIPSALKAQILGFSPNNMDLGALRDIPEERVTAVLGIPAAVVGLGSGLQQTKVGATMVEMVAQAYEGCVIPTQRAMGAEIRSQLLVDYGDVRGYRIGWDYSQVKALSEDENKRWQRYGQAFRDCLIMRSVALTALGMESTPEDEVYMVPLSVEFVGPGAPEPEPVPPALAAAPKSPTEDLQDVEQPQPTKGLQCKALTGDQKDAIGTLFIKRATKREARFKKFMAGYFAKQGEAVVAEIERNKGQKALPEDEFWARQREALRKAARALVELYLVEAAKEAIADYSLGIDFDLHNPRVTAWIGKRLRTMSKQITQTSKDDVTRILREAEADGISISEMADRIKGYYDGIGYRAERAARTETIYASNNGNIEAYRQAGLDGWEWLTTFDDRTCDEYDCQANNGKIFPLSEPFEPEHPNCRCCALPVVN